MSKLRLEGQLDMDGSGWEKAIRQAGESVDRLSEHQLGHLKSMLASAFSVAVIEEAGRAAVEYGEKIYDTSRRVGETTDMLQALDFALKTNSSSLESAVGVMEKFNIAKSKAFGGGAEAEKYAQAFEKMGISLKELGSMSSGQFLIAASEAFKNAGNPQDLVAAFREIGGRGAGDLIPALRNGLKESADEAKRLGQVMDSDIIVLMKMAGDDAKVFWGWVKDIGAAFVAVAEVILSSVIPAAKAAGIYMKDIATLHSPATALKDSWKAFDEGMAESARKFQAMKSKLNENKAPLDLEESADKITPKIKALSALYEHLHDLENKNATAGLSNEDKLNKLVSDRLEMKRQMEDATGNETEQVKLQIRYVENESEIQRVKSEMAKKRDRISTLKSDALTSVGNFMGSAQFEVRTIERQMLDAQQENTRALQANTAAHRDMSPGGNSLGSGIDDQVAY